METIVCGVCSKRVPSSLAHGHHAKPQAAGGTDLDLMDLCSGCHDNVHRISDMLRGPRASEARDTVNAYYADNQCGARRCLDLAVKVVRHMSEKETGQYTVAAHEDVEITISLPMAVKQALMLVGRESRDPRTNRRLGMAGVMRKILIDFAVRKFPAIGQEIIASREQNKGPKRPPIRRA